MSKIKLTSTFDTTADFILFEGDIKKLLPQIPDDFVKLVVTSPPYNIGKIYEKRLNINEYLNEQKKIIAECVRVCHPEGSICWQIGNYVENGKIIPIDVLLYPIFSSFNLYLRNRIVWHFGRCPVNSK